MINPMRPDDTMYIDVKLDRDHVIPPDTWESIHHFTVAHDKYDDFPLGQRVRASLNGSSGRGVVILRDPNHNEIAIKVYWDSIVRDS